MNIHPKHLVAILAILLLPSWLAGQCVGNVSWNGGTPAAGTLTANATILGSVGVTVGSAGSFSGARPTYTSIIEPYGGFTYQTLWISRGASFAAGTYTYFKLNTPLPSSLIHISVRDIRGDGFNAEHQRVEGYLNGVPVPANFQDPINGAFITGGNIINGATTTTSLVQSAMRAFFNGPVDSIVVKSTSWSDYVIVNLHVRCDILLPYQLIKFTGEALDKGNLLSWETSSEASVKAYELQRSTNGTDWKIIGQLNAPSTGPGTRQYQFLDQSPPVGYSLYRIYSIETDGHGTHSRVISINRSATPGRNQSAIFPNPAKNMLHVVLPKGTTGAAEAEIRSVNGQSMVRRVFQGSIALNLNHFPRGIYLLIVSIPGKGRESHRIILH